MKWESSKAWSGSSLFIGACMLSVALLLLSGCSSQVHVSSTSESSSAASSSTSASEELSLYENDVVLVMFPAGTPMDELQAFLAEEQLVALDEIDETTASNGLPIRCSVPAGSTVEDTVDRLSANTHNVIVQPNYLYQLTTEDIDAAVQAYTSSSTTSN